jgi:ketosteroid isomerase-like protein
MRAAMSATEELIALEITRCEAISAGDLDAVAALLADDLSHTHVTGATQDKAALLAGLKSRPRTTTRGDGLRVRVYGDTAVMTGTLRNVFPPTEPGGDAVEMEAHALQVWVRTEPGWLQVAFAASGSAPRR